MEENEIPTTSMKWKTPPSRPRNISILAILSFILGLIILGGNLTRISNTYGIAIFFSSLIFALLYLAAGIGMWLGKKWGWWAGTFSYMLMLYNNVETILLLSTPAKIYSISVNKIAINKSEYISGAVVLFLLLLYFFSEDVLKYFELETMPKWRTILLMISIVFIVALINTITTTI